MSLVGFLEPFSQPPNTHTHTITRRTCQVHTEVWRPEVGTEPSALLQRADATVPPIFLNLSERIYPFKKCRKCILKPLPVINSWNSVAVYPSAHNAPASFCPSVLVSSTLIELSASASGTARSSVEADPPAQFFRATQSANVTTC